MILGLLLACGARSGPPEGWQALDLGVAAEDARWVGPQQLQSGLRMENAWARPIEIDRVAWSASIGPLQLGSDDEDISLTLLGRESGAHPITLSLPPVAPPGSTLDLSGTISWMGPDGLRHSSSFDLHPALPPPPGAPHREVPPPPPPPLPAVPPSPGL